MEYLVAFLLGIINAMLVQNTILTKFLGICPFLGVSKKPQSSIGMGFAVLFVITLSTNICWPIYQYVLVPAEIPFMDTIVFILVIASLVQICGLFIKKFSPALYKSLGIYLPLITTNCAVLGTVQLNNSLTFLNSIANAIGTSLGFMLVIFVFSCIRVRLENSNVPKAFKGLPIALITASIMALAFVGLVFNFVA